MITTTSGTGGRWKHRAQCGYWIDDSHTCPMAAPDPDAPAPLPPTPPTRWSQREERVAWLLRHLTRGEHARLYEILHNDGHRLDNVRRTWTGEKAGLDRPAV